jgi:hypothetical protein
VQDQGAPWHAIIAKLRAAPVRGAPNDVVTPPAEGTPVPVVWHGVVLPDDEDGVDVLGTTTRGVKLIRGDNGFRATDGGLRPPLPNSVAPSGIPARPTDDAEPVPPPDEADATGPAKELPPVEAQVPDAVPVMPPPSNIVELPPIPKDVCGIEPPMPEQVVLLPVVAPIDDAPEGIGLTPGDASSVAPKGKPVGATGEPGPMPSGDVMPSGEELGEMVIPPTCATAEPQPNRTAAVAANIKRVIIGSTLSCIGPSWRAARRPHP